MADRGCVVVHSDTLKSLAAFWWNEKNNILLSTPEFPSCPLVSFVVMNFCVKNY